MGMMREARRSGRLDESQIVRTDRMSIGMSTPGDRLNVTVFGRKRDSAHANTQPAAMETGARMSAMSHVCRPKIRRICRRVAPTARSMPISSTRFVSWPSMACATPTPALKTSDAPSRITISVVMFTYLSANSSRGLM